MVNDDGVGGPFLIDLDERTGRWSSTSSRAARRGRSRWPDDLLAPTNTEGVGFSC